MAKSRRGSRRANRSRRNRKGGGLFSKLYSPINHLLQATGNTVGVITNTTRNVAKRTVSGVDNIGKSVTGHANMAVRNLLSRKRKGGRRASRKNRKSRSRRNRK